MYSILLDVFKFAVLFFPFGFILIGVVLINTGLYQKKEREKGCEYCEDEVLENACDSDGMMRICKGNEHCLPYIAVDNDTYGTSDLFDISYCPMCGSKMDKEREENE